MHLTGFDIQTSSLPAASLRPQFLRDVIITIDPTYANRVYEFDTAFITGFGGNVADKGYWRDNGDKLKVDYEELVKFLDGHTEALINQFPESPLFPLIARQTAWSMIQFIRASQAGDEEGYVAVRDETMADNVDFILEKLYPDEKMVIWAHNAHIRYDNQTECVKHFETTRTGI